MKATLRVMYGKMLQTRLPLYSRPIGTIVRMYLLAVILIVFRLSRKDVVRAMICVITVAKSRCEQTNVMA